MLLFFLYFDSSAQQTNGFHYINVDDCCVQVSIINNEPKRKWTLYMGDGTIFNSTDYGSDTVYYCYTSGGSYDIAVFYETGGGASSIVKIDVSNCKFVCDYYLCQTDYATAFGCSVSVTVGINGNEVTIPFSQPITNATVGIPLLIAELQAIANNLGVIYVNKADHVSVCPKMFGDPDSFGHFFLQSDVKFIRLNGGQLCSNAQTPNAGWQNVPFYNNCK